ncbi:lytic polysaccharide monooxygenase [Streptomyces sp. NPDC088789]|uniref:lytic polysaccharide monooxygenase n=1 Tax=Streptomyces sp. NPDC088789 TaxID=3365899 RepID=UPI0038125335
MNTKRRVACAIGALLAPVLAISLPAGSAGAHGWVTDPGSRQDQCVDGTVSCGQIKYEPQSVEGPKGLRSCSGGNAQFSELDDDSKGWRVTPVASTHTFTWHHTARHATANWQYYIGGTKIAEFNGNSAQPPADVSHQVNFGSFTGRQKVLAVWNVSDTGNAFYACVDVNIGGTGGGGGGGGEPTTCAAPAWSAGTVYNGGDTVSLGNHTWRAKWWVSGEQPGTTGQWGVWEDLGACA